MKSLISLYRIIKNGILNLKRNLWLAGASTLIMTVTLIILSVLSLLFIITNYSIESIQQRVDISAYFKTGTTEPQILVVRDDLRSNPKVKTVTYISSEQAFRDFKEKHKNDKLIMESIDELSENPLPATLQIKADNLDDYSAIAENLSSDKYKDKIEKVNFEDNRVIINRLNTLLKFIITFGLILMTVFCLIAILVIFNTIALTIYNRREEVEIMRLVGATNWYIRGPFIVEALMYSVIAAIITSILLTPIYFNILPKIGMYLAPGNQIFNGNIINFLLVILLQLIIAFTLSTISSLWAMRKYLKI